MSGIGPQLPPHLQKQLEAQVDDSDSDGDVGPAPPSIGPQIPSGASSFVAGIGPSIPAHLLQNKAHVEEENDDEDLGPQPIAGPSRPPPPQISPSEPAGSSAGKRVLGPALPSYGPTYNAATYSQLQGEDEDDSDEDVGPKPLPAGMRHEERSAIEEFMEREERRRQQLEEANKPKAPQREEWMLVPPSHSDLLGKLDPTKMKKSRQFSKSTAEPRSNDNSLWTETPAERQKRLEDETLGRKKRALDPTPVDDDPESKRRKKEEARIRRGVEEYTKKQRGGALVEQHASAISDKKDDSDEPPVIWDHARDMAIGGRLMDDGKRKQMLQEAKGLDSRFSSGKSGGFL